MSDKEKLVELLDDIQARGEDFTDYEIYGMRVPDTVSNEDVASHLIAHGVTVQELDGCQHCMGVSYTDNPFTVITQMGREVKTQFNFCPNCGRRLPKPPKGE